MLVKEVQYDHLGIEVIHVDFARVGLNEKREGHRAAGAQGHARRAKKKAACSSRCISELEIECLVTDIPDAIRHNVSEMKLDEVLHIKDLKLPAGREGAAGRRPDRGDGEGNQGRGRRRPAVEGEPPSRKSSAARPKRKRGRRRLKVKHAKEKK